MSGSQKPKNVIFLTIDALTFTRLGAGGGQPSPSPNLDGLMERGLSFRSSFACGCPTMFAFPAIFTSTLPLDDGGYGMGIRGRGPALAERFLEAGYATGGFCTGFYQGRLFGYDRGFEDYHQMYSLDLFTKVIRGLYLDYLTAMRRGDMVSEVEAVMALEPFLAEYFPCLLDYCGEKQQESRSGRLLLSPKLHGRSFAMVEDAIRLEHNAYLESPTAYTRRLLEMCEAGEETIFDLIPALGEVVRPTAETGKRNALMRANSLRPPEGPLGPSAAYMIENLLRWIDAQDSEKPFFAWAHLIDCHDLNYTSHDLEDTGQVEMEIDAATRLKEKLCADPKRASSNHEYDLAIRYSDEQLGRLIESLENRGLMEKTIFVVYSDHGGWKNGYPTRPPGTDYMSFFDESYHVPFVIVDPDRSPAWIDGLASALDVAPTILESAGLHSPSEFRGAAANDASWPGRDLVIMEHMGSGPCDFATKAINLCLRTESHKVVCEIPPLATRGDGFLREVYDLSCDPLEQNNLAIAGDFPGHLEWVIEAAEDRVRELFSFNFPDLHWEIDDPHGIESGLTSAPSTN